MDLAAEETNGNHLSKVGGTALEKIEGIYDQLSEDEQGLMYRGSMLVVYTRCCECKCTPAYTRLWNNKYEWDCDQEKKSVYVMGLDTHFIYSLDDFMKNNTDQRDASGMGEFRTAGKGKWTPGKIAVAMFMAARERGCSGGQTSEE